MAAVISVLSRGVPLGRVEDNTATLEPPHGKVLQCLVYLRYTGVLYGMLEPLQAGYGGGAGNTVDG